MVAAGSLYAQNKSVTADPDEGEYRKGEFYGALVKPKSEYGLFQLF
jgi:hypothetical protein